MRRAPHGTGCLGRGAEHHAVQDNRLPTLLFRLNQTRATSDALKRVSKQASKQTDNHTSSFADARFVLPTSAPSE